MRTWLVKSEPSVFSIDDLARDGVTGWEGVRNFQARNSMRDDMKLGDLVLFYHSSCEVIGVAGVARVAREAYPDPTQFEPGNDYEDPGSDPANPRWVCVDLGFAERFASPVLLAELKADPQLEGMLVLRKGQRLSVQPVDPMHFERVLALGRAKEAT